MQIAARHWATSISTTFRLLIVINAVVATHKKNISFLIETKRRTLLTFEDFIYFYFLLLQNWIHSDQWNFRIVFFYIYSKTNSIDSEEYLRSNNKGNIYFCKSIQVDNKCIIHSKLAKRVGVVRRLSRKKAAGSLHRWFKEKRNKPVQVC